MPPRKSIDNNNNNNNNYNNNNYNNNAKWLSMLRSHSLVTYSIGIFYFNIYMA